MIHIILVFFVKPVDKMLMVNYSKETMSVEAVI